MSVIFRPNKTTRQSFEATTNQHQTNHHSPKIESRAIDEEQGFGGMNQDLNIANYLSTN